MKIARDLLASGRLARASDQAKNTDDRPSSRKRERDVTSAEEDALEKLVESA